MTTGPASTPPPGAEGAPEAEAPLTAEVALERDLEQARAYGAQAVKLVENLARAWEDVAPRLRTGWASRHAELCPFAHDWRDSFPAVRRGWLEAGGSARSGS